MWEWGYWYKIWYLDVMDIERNASIVALNEEHAMDIFQSFDKHRCLQITYIEEIVPVK